MNKYFCCGFKPAVCLTSTPANTLIQTYIPHLTSIIAVKSENWSPPTNNGSCLGHDPFIIYTLLKPWSRKVQFTWWVSIVFLTRYPRTSQTLVSLVKQGSDISPCNIPGTKVHRLKTEAPIHSECQISLTIFQSFEYYIGYNNSRQSYNCL